MLHMNVGKVLIAALLIFSGAPARSAELITNGGFETTVDVFTAPGWTKPSEVVKYHIVADYAGCCFITGTYPFGDRAAFFGGGDVPGGTIFQNFSTIAGQSYSYSFLYGAISETRPQKMRYALFDVTGATPIISATISSMGTTDVENMMDSISGTFIALSSLTRISFQDISLHSLNVDGVVDNVSVLGPAPVPEPSTYMLMMVGLGVLAFVARRRRARTAIAA